MVSQCGAGAWLKGWLAEISTGLWEAVVQLRRVRDDALYKSAITLLYNACTVVVVCGMQLTIA